jgi:hypothetical protein
MSLAVDFMAGFVTGFASTAAMGAFAKFVAGGFTTGPTAKVAAVCVAIGYALGRFAYAGSVAADPMVALGGAAGSALALAGLWAWLLKKPRIQ